MIRPMDFSNQDEMNNLTKQLAMYKPEKYSSEVSQESQYSPEVSQLSQEATNPSYQINPVNFEKQSSILSSPAQIGTRFGARQSADVFSKGINWGVDIKVREGSKAALPEGQWEVLEAFGGAAPSSGYIGNGTNRGYGNSVFARNTKTGEMVRMSHLNQVAVKPGQVVQGGQVIGLTGSTGNSSGPHLDWEYYDASGKLRDPLRRYNI